MKPFVMFFVTLTLSASVAAAAPGDPRILQGTLEWPATVTREPFVVVRGEDGRLYYADISAAQVRGGTPLTSGARVGVLGVEGARPHEISALAVTAGEASSLVPMGPAVQAGSSGPAPLASEHPGDNMWRVDGTVQAVNGTRVSVRRADAHTVTVDVSQLSDVTLRALRPGDRVSLFGVPREDRQLVANGYIQSEPSSPSASPGSTR